MNHDKIRLIASGAIAGAALVSIVTKARRKRQFNTILEPMSSKQLRAAKKQLLESAQTSQEIEFPKAVVAVWMADCVSVAEMHVAMIHHVMEALDSK